MSCRELEIRAYGYIDNKEGGRYIGVVSRYILRGRNCWGNDGGFCI